MRFDRREFDWYSAAGALAFAGCKCKPARTTAAGPYMSVGPRPTGPSLEIDFEGLYLIEQKTNSMVVRLIEGAAVGLPNHAALIEIPAAVIDQGEPDRKRPAGVDELWEWDLKGLDVTMPESDTGQADLTSEGPSGQDDDEMPRDDAGWSSLARVPDLRVLCGATKVNPASYTSFASSVALNHGHVRALKPRGPGEGAVWKCTDPTGTVLMCRAFSNKVRYTCPNQGEVLTIHVGSKPIVFKPSVTVQLRVTNLPAKKPPYIASRDPNMDHFSGLAELVDKKFTPTITLAEYTPNTELNVYPDYCPGARI